MGDPKGTVSNELQQREKPSIQSWNSKCVISLRGLVRDLTLAQRVQESQQWLSEASMEGRDDRRGTGDRFYLMEAVCLECSGENFIANTCQNSEQLGEIGFMLIVP